MQIDPTKLVEARLARTMSQEEAAIATDLSARTIQRIEAGHAASLESTKALLTIFGADILHDPESAVEPAAASPWRHIAARVARASRRSASFGWDGLRLLFVAVFMLVALAKPFVPDQTGLFVRDSVVTMGVLVAPPAGASELLGYWITPVMLAVAVLLLLSIGRIRKAALRAPT